jgi:tetratricopeptide (TPR) repeat protein
MKVSLRKVSRTGMVLLALVLVGQTVSAAALAAEMPITTKSEEARKLFIQGRDKMEYWHTEEAHKLFSQAVVADPDFALGYLYQAVTGVGDKDFQASLNKSVGLASGTSQAEQLMIMGNKALYLDNDPNKRIELFQKIVSQYPEDKRAHFYLGSCYRGIDNNESAVKEYKNALAIDESFAPAHEQLGYCYFSKGMFGEAEQHMKRLVNISPQEPNPYDCLGDLYRKMGRFDEAVKDYGKAVALDPTFAASEAKKGITLVFLGKYDEGRKAIAKAMEMETDPANKAYDQGAIARTFIYQGDTRNALEALDTAIQTYHQHGLPADAAFAHMEKAMICCDSREPGKAEEEIAVFRKIGENPALVPIQKSNIGLMTVVFEAWVSAIKKDFDEAMAKVAEYRAGVEARKDPSMANYPVWLEAWVYLEKGEAATADKLFSKTKIDEPMFMYFAAVAKEKAGDVAGAKQLFKKVADWNDDYFWYPFVRSKAKAKI